MQTQQTAGPHLPTPQELAMVIRYLRDARKWSQETLAALSGLSVRTIQRAERGEPSDLDTRRALARAFECEDLDIFNKPCSVPTDEELKAQQEKFEREHVTLDAVPITSGRQLALLFETASMDCSFPAIELEEQAAADFAGLIDYLRDYRDCVELYTETQNLEVFSDIQQYIDSLDSAGITLCCAHRRTKLVARNWPDQTPWGDTLVYLSAFAKTETPSKMIVSRQINIG